MKYSIVMPTYNRSHFVYHSLKSIQRQRIEDLDYEIIVLNDGIEDETRKVCTESDAAEGLNIRYYHTGTRVQKYWRNMGFTANIGIRLALGEVIILTSSDIYHVGQPIREIVKNCAQHVKGLCTVSQVYDDDGQLIDFLNKNPHDSGRGLRKVLRKVVRSQPLPGRYPANPDVPFLLGIHRRLLIGVGGYDEDFIGPASEDCDLLDRLKKLGAYYVYGSKGNEVYHMYHGRRSISELQNDPGFHHNVALRNERKNQIVRNSLRNWGELINSERPWNDAPIHMVLWVTSKCNMDCEYCNQKDTRKGHPDYSMSLKELERFIDYSLKHRLHYTTVELTGGEVSLWDNLEEAVEMLYTSGVADTITFITNGNDPDRTSAVANKYHLRYTVSASQATAQQIERHKARGVGVYFNHGAHVPLPTKFMRSSLPCDCSQRLDTHGRVVRQMTYIAGQLWYCCMAYPNSVRMGTRSTPSLSVDFYSDWRTHFAQRWPYLPLCAACTCNNKVYSKLQGREVEE